MESQTAPVLETNSDQRLIVLIAYGLYGLALFGLLLPSIAAVILNYLKVDDSLPLYRSHHQWMIRTFWWALLWCVIGGVLAIVLIGWAVLFAAWVWWLYRMLRGVLAVLENKVVVPSAL